MVYGIARMLNFAHGDVIMVGAYMSYCVTSYLGLPPAVGVLAAVIVCTLLGVLIEGLAYKPLRGVPSLAVLITAIGVSYFLQNAAQLIFGSAPKNFKSIVAMKPLVLFNGGLTVTGEVIVTYEDEAGNETRYEKEMNLSVYENVVDDGSMDDIYTEPAVEESSGLPLPALIGIIAAVVVIVVVHSRPIPYIYQMQILYNITLIIFRTKFNIISL